jgi:aspartokinase-like uncharacterized kinase
MTALFLAASPAVRMTHAQETPLPESSAVDLLQQELDQKAAALEEKAKARQTEFQGRGDDLGKEAKAAFKLDMTVKWNNRKMSLDLPQVTMKTKKMSMSLPQVTMRTNRIVFDTPSVRMVNKKIGQYPEFHGPFKIVWKDVITKVPEISPQRQEIKMDIPEFKWDRTDWSMDIPQVKMNRTDFVMKLPETTVKEAHFVVPINNSDLEKKSAILKEDAEKFAAEIKAEADVLAQEYLQKFMARGLTAVNSEVNNVAKKLADERSTTAKKYSDAIAAIEKSIADSSGHLKSEDLKTLTDQRERLVKEMAATDLQFAEVAKDLEVPQTQTKEKTDEAVMKAEADKG